MRNNAVKQPLAHLIKIPTLMTVIQMMVTLGGDFTKRIVLHAWQEKWIIQPTFSSLGIIMGIGMLGLLLL